MNQLMEHIQNERRRLREVRQALSRALESAESNGQGFAPFYVAIADYIETAMDRLDTQDVRMGDMLRSRVSKTEPDSRVALQELDERLAGNQAHLKKFLKARDAIKSGGDSAIPRFESAGRSYTDYIVSNMGHHGGSTKLARQHFTEQDWEYMANISDDDTARERDLYKRVFDAAPEGFEQKAAS